MDKYKLIAFIAVLISITICLVTKSYEAAAFSILLQSVLPSIVPTKPAD